MSKSEPNRSFFGPRDLETWQMFAIGYLFCAPSSFVHRFVVVYVLVQKRSIRVKVVKYFGLYDL